MTISEIAKEVGVCKATVSLILNGKAKQYHISDATIRTVQDYCRSINYQPNIHAIRMGRKIVSNVMLLLDGGEGYGQVNTFADYNVAQITGGIAVAAKEAGYTLSVRIMENGMNGDDVFNSFRNREIDGMIYYGVKIPDCWYDVFREEKRKVIGIGISPRDGVSTVNINNREISFELTEKLLKRNYKNILYFTGTFESYPGIERYMGFVEACKVCGLEVNEENVIHCNFSEQNAYELMDEFCRSGKSLPDAIVCANDAMAIGVVHALNKYNYRVPEDIAVSGGDNIRLAAYVTPSLTTFENHAELMGREAFRLLHRQIRGENAEGNIIISSEIIERQST